jgi:mannose-6-phosphate isomerase-like protein (cupin superfamily)
MSDTKELTLTPDQIEMPSGPEKSMKAVKYSRPSEEASKLLVPLAHSDIMFCAVQVVREGGENNLHSHEAMDGLWFVLRGRVRFYGEGHKLIGEFGQHEGVFVPRNVPYWFESVGDEPLEILQAESIDRRLEHNRRTDYEPQKASATTHKVVRTNS